MTGRFLLGFVLGALLMVITTAAANEYVLQIPAYDFVRPDYDVMCRQIHQRALEIYRDMNPEQTS